MAVFRIHHTDQYVVMSNHHLRDKTLSLKAKGLLSQMLSLPAEWDYTVAGLAAINQEKESAIETALKELKKSGYLIVEKKMPNETDSGRIEYVYNIYEIPAEEQYAEKQGVEKQGVEFLPVEFQGVENRCLNKYKDKENKDNKNKEYKKTESKNGFAVVVEEFSESQKVRDAVFEFLKMRKHIKKPMTERALVLMLDKLRRLSSNETEQIAILEQSIEHDWQTVYPLKEQKPSGSSFDVETFFEAARDASARRMK